MWCKKCNINEYNEYKKEISGESLKKSLDDQQSKSFQT